MKAERFAIGGAEIQKVQTDDRESEIRGPSRNPGRDMVAFAEREKEMGHEIGVEKDKDDRRRDAAQNAASRITDPERRRDEDNDQTSPR